MTHSVPKEKEKESKKKSGTYVPKSKLKKYKVILVKTNTIIVSVDGNGEELPKARYPNVSIGDEIEVKV